MKLAMLEIVFFFRYIDAAVTGTKAAIDAISSVYFKSPLKPYSSDS